LLAESENDLEQKLTSIKELMSEKSMEVNPSKCRVMRIHKNNNECVKTSTYENETIPNVDNYVYLGINFNKDLDYNMMSQYRVAKGLAAKESIKNSLLNTKIPLTYKKMLIQNFLCPVLSYGAEIFGMNEKRLEKQKKVLDNSLKNITLKSNFCRKRVYEELDICPLEISAALNRARPLING